MLLNRQKEKKETGELKENKSNASFEGAFVLKRRAPVVRTVQ